MFYRLALVLIIFIINSPMSHTNKKKLKLSMLLLLIFASIRGTGDGDYYVYKFYASLIYSWDAMLDKNFPAEVGFRVLSLINNTLGLDYQFVLIAMNIISLTLIYKFILKYSKQYGLSVLLFLPFYFQFDMQASRTAVAIGISTLSLKYLKSGEKIKSYISILLASLFHKSALVMMPVIFLAKIKISNVLQNFILLFSFVFSLLISINNIIPKGLELIGFTELARRFNIYISSNDYGYSFKLYDPRFIFVLTMFILGLNYLNKKKYTERLYINFLWLNVLLIVILHENTIFITRIVSYINIYTLVSVPEILDKIKTDNSINKYRVTRFYVIIVQTIYTASFVFNQVPYKVFFLE